MSVRLKSVLAVVAVALLSSCVPPNEPLVQPYGDGTHWIVRERLVYEVGNTGQKIVVPEGFVTDFASIPRPLWSLYSPTGVYGSAAVIHDYLYWDQACSREQADALFRMAMRESNVSGFTTWIIHRAVRVGGGSPWKHNTLERQARKPRIIPPEHLAERRGKPWREYQTILQARGVRAAPAVRPVTYCTAAP